MKSQWIAPAVELPGMTLVDSKGRTLELKCAELLRGSAIQPRRFPAIALLVTQGPAGTGRLLHLAAINDFSTEGEGR